MLDHLKFTTELDRIRSWDSDEVTYYYEIDTLHNSGNVRKNVCGRRKNGADNLEGDIMSLSRDASVVDIYISYYNGKERSNTRKDRKLTGTDKPDVVLRVSNPGLDADPAKLRDEDAGALIPSHGIATLMGLQGLSGVDALNGLVNARIEDVRKEFEIDRLKERLENAKYEKNKLELELYSVQKERDELDEELEEMRRNYDEAKKYHPATMGGIGRMVLSVAEGAIGNLAKSYAKRRPDQVLGLLGPAALEMLTSEGEESQSAPVSGPGDNPLLSQISLWMQSQDANTIQDIYQLICEWDKDRSALARSIAAVKNNVEGNETDRD